jgi:hypothetical protein
VTSAASTETAPQVQFMKFQKNDGGRLKAGWKGKNAGDCVARAIAIALKIPYREVRAELDALNKEMTGGFETTTNHGTTAAIYHRYLSDHGWVPILTKGAYLKDIPTRGIHIAVMTGHIAAVVDGTLHDAWDSRKCRRTRCGSPTLRGYYTQAPQDVL